MSSATRAVRRTALALRTQSGEISLTRDALASAWLRLNRLTKSYEPGLRLIEVLVDSAAISLDDEST